MIERPTDLYVVTSLDASSGKSKEVGDFSAITVWGKDFETESYWLLTCDRGRWDTYDKVRAMFNLDRAFNPTFNLIEWDAFGNELKNVIEKESQQRGEYFPYRLIKPDKNKERRAMAITDLFHKGKIYFPKRRAQRVIDELLMFPTGDYDDYVDSCAMALNFLRRQRPREKFRKNIDRPFLKAKPNKAGRLV